MILLIVILLTALEAVFEGLKIRKKYLASELTEFIFSVIIYGILIAWIWYVQPPKYSLELWKLIIGIILVRFALFDVIWNISAGQPIFYYGTTKLYDRIMFKLGSWGWMMKAICGIVGIVFLLGWS